MKKISLKNLNLNEVEQLSREELKNVVGGSGYGSGGSDCGENAHFETFANKCVCNSGYYFSSPYNRCIEGTGSGSGSGDVKIEACVDKDEGDDCSFWYQGYNRPGWCARVPSNSPVLHCSDLY